MASKSKSPNVLNKSVDSDIEKVLQQAFVSSVRQTEEYLFGRFEERIESERELFKKSFETIRNVAETFFRLIKENFPKVTIVQFRIGIDYSSRIPAVLMVVSEKDSSCLKQLRELARKVEFASWSQGMAEGYIWTKSSKNLDDELIETDFPYYRKVL